MANELFIKHKIIDVTPDLVEDGSIYFERSTNLIKVVESDSSIITVGVKKGTGVNSAILNDPNNIASGENALAQGSNSTASGQCAHAEGSSTQATGEFSHAEGYNTVAAGKYSHAEGYGTETKNEGEHAQGRWNVSSDTPGYETVHTIGYGTGSSDRKNLYELHRTGNQYIIGLGDYDGTNASTAKSVQQVIADLTTLVTANSDLYLIDRVQSGSIEEWIGGWDNVVLAIENKKLFGITDSTNSYNSKNRVIFPAMVDRYPQNVIKWSYLYQDPVANTGYSINTITITKSDNNTLSKQEQSFSLGGDVDSLISVSDSMVQVGNGTDTINLKTYNRPYVNNNEQLAYLSDVEDILEPYTINLTNLLSAEDSESISTAIGGIDNLNATVQDNRIIVGTISNGNVSVSIRILGNVTTLYYLLDSVLGLTLNEVKITNTSGTLSKSVTTHSVLTENMVINSLNSDETTLPLSAAQGKALNEKIVNGGKVYVIDGSTISTVDSPSSEQISEAIGGWDNLVNAIQNNYAILIAGNSSNPDVYYVMPALGTVINTDVQLIVNSGDGVATYVITNSGELSLQKIQLQLINTTSSYEELQTSNKTFIGSINELNTLVNSKASSQDITNAINALDKAEVSAGTGEIISSVSQEDGIVSASKRSLTSDDIPTIPQSKIQDLTDTLAGKQGTLTFNTPYDASTNKAATMQDITDAVSDKVEQSDITSAIQALDSSGQTCSSGEVISSVSQADGIVTVQKKTLAEADIPNLSQSKITGLSESLNGKQDNLTPGVGLEITEGNVINVTLDTTVFFVAEQLPASPTAEQKKKICLIPATSTSVNNEYTEYVWVVDDTHPSGYWEEFGTYKSEVDLTPYLKSADAANTYLSKTDASSTYLSKDDAASTYATQTNLTAHTGNTSNPHNVTKAQVGLGNVDNTSDADKPISTATQTALDGKQATLVSGTNIKTLNGESLLGSGNISIPVPSFIDVSTLFADTASIASGISTQIAALGNSGVTEFPVLYGGSAIGNIKPTWIRTTSGVTNMMCIADNKIWYFEIQGTTVQRAELAIS